MLNCPFIAIEPWTSANIEKYRALWLCEDDTAYYEEVDGTFLFHLDIVCQVTVMVFHFNSTKPNETLAY